MTLCFILFAVVWMGRKERRNSYDGVQKWVRYCGLSHINGPHQVLGSGLEDDQVGDFSAFPAWSLCVDRVLYSGSERPCPFTVSFRFHCYTVTDCLGSFRTPNSICLNV